MLRGLGTLTLPFLERKEGLGLGLAVHYHGRPPGLGATADRKTLGRRLDRGVWSAFALRSIVYA